MALSPAMVAPAQPADREAIVGDLWRFYEEHAAQARQHENLRATVTSILTGFAAALVGLASTGGLEESDVAAGALVVAIGLLGGLLSLKHYERNRFHARVMGTVRNHIADLRNQPGHAPLATPVLRQRAEEQHANEFSLFRRSAKRGTWLVRIGLFQLWVGLDLIVAAVGIGIVVASLT